MRKVSLGILLCAVSLVAGDPARLESLSGAPPYPPDNPPTADKIRLGEMLFFEQRLSGGARRSCATCHKPELYFMDGLSRAWGLHEAELRRKTPSLLNVGWQRSMFFDGRATTLEDQVAFPLRAHREMDLDPEEAAERIRRDPVYQKHFGQAFPGEPVTFGLIAKAIASYERTLVSYDSDLDRYLRGDDTALAPVARRGMQLFTGKARCITCHYGPLLTDHQFHYTGVPEQEGDSKPGTRYKTATLRDVTRRYSFMHNGYYLRVEHVINHYIQGGAAPEGLQSEISPITLTHEEKAQLIEFLKSLKGRVTGEIELSPREVGMFNAKPESPSSGDVQNPSYLK